MGGGQILYETIKTGHALFSVYRNPYLCISFMKYSALLLFFLFCLSANAQVPRKTLTAVKSTADLNLDGALTDSIWRQLQPRATNFVMRSPGIGKPIPERFATSVKVYYSDEAIYIGAQMLDSAPDSILYQFTERDTYNENTDWFGVSINPFNDGLSDFNFWVTAAGTKAESRTTADGEVFGWNTIWKTAVQRHDSGWSCEFKIPYLALRFPQNEQNNWALNFTRSIRRLREQYSWNLVDRNSGYREEFQAGQYKGVEKVDAPVRLSLIPFAVGQVNNFNGQTSTNFNAGMDLKYGINQSFTLDMTLIPDFSQVAIDEQFVNFSPFENQFAETRQFFTEGTELFSIGDVFYSRRIGGTPKNITNVNLSDSGAVEVQAEFTRLLNATKISGRTEGNLGIGFLNAVTDRSFSTFTDGKGNQREVLVEPLTNYNVLVLDQRFKNNSSLSFVNTNTLREGSSVDANVAALVSSINLWDAHYRIDASLKRSDRMHPDSTQTGHRAELRLGDVDGHWRWAVREDIRTPDYDINDLGFITRSNQIRTYAEVSYQTFEPSGKLNRQSHQLFGAFSTLYEGQDYEDFFMGWSSFWLRRNFFAYGLDINLRPRETFDFFEARTPGQPFRLPARTFVSAFISTDYRKELALDVRANYTHVNEFNTNSFNLNVAPRLRLGNHFFTVVSTDYNHQINEVGFARKTDSDVFFGRRKRQTVTNTIDARYVFNPKTTLSLSLLHLWTGVQYRETFLLQPDGRLQPGDFEPAENLNFNNFNMDVRFSWWFAPASELTFLYRNIIAVSDNRYRPGYTRNFGDVFSNPAENNISLRISYFLDYNQVVKKRQKRQEG